SFVAPRRNNENAPAMPDKPPDLAPCRDFDQAPLTRQFWRLRQAARPARPARPAKPARSGSLSDILVGEMNSMSNQNALDQLSINTIRTLAMDAVQKANSGHPGMPMGMAPAAYVLWTKFLRYNPKNPSWSNRDRFVLSAGHGSMLLYSLLYLTGYDDYPLDQLKLFRQWGGLTPGHPESELSSAIETTTGPLGQGFGNGVGMAIGAEYLAANFNRPDHALFDYYIYAIV